MHSGGFFVVFSPPLPLHKKHGTMQVSCELYQLQQVINEVALKYAAIGAAQALQIAGVSKACVSRREAERLYGARTVARWITEGRIRPVQDKERGRLRISVQELLDAATSENKLIKERKKKGE